MVPKGQVIWSRPYYEKINIAASLSVVSVSFRNKRVQKKIKWLYERFRSVLVQELEELSDQEFIEKGSVNSMASVIMSMVEGSRHFHHFFIKTKDLKQYNRDMINAAMCLIKDRTWQEE